MNQSTDENWRTRFRRGPSRGFLAGLGLTSCFLDILLPSPAAALIMLPAVAHIILCGIRLRPLTDMPPIVAVLGALLTLTLLALVTSSYQWGILRELIWAVAMTLLVMLSLDPEDQTADISKGFFVGIATTATVVATLGLSKYWLQLNGYISAIVLDSCDGYYPQGSTFCSDYNLFALYMVVASIGLTALFFGAKVRAVRFIILLALGLCLAAGLLSGSRRFMFVAALVPILWIVSAAWRNELRSMWLLTIPLLVVGAAYFGLDNRRYPAVPDSDVVMIEEAVADIRAILGDWLATDPDSPPTYRLAARTVLPDALAGTMDAPSGYGLAPRIERWKFGWSMIESDGYLLGRGFAYQHQFACEFVQCLHIDYPHSPIMSAWIAFGAIGLLIALAFYGVTAANMLLAGKRGLLSGVSFIPLAVFPYSLISGDTIFSMTPAVVAALIVGAEARVANSDLLYALLQGDIRLKRRLLRPALLAAAEKNATNRTGKIRRRKP